MTRIIFLPVCSIFPFVLYFGWTRFGCIEEYPKNCRNAYFPLLCAKEKHGVSAYRSERPVFSSALCGAWKPPKLPREWKTCRNGKSEKFRSSLFKGLQVSKGQSPLFAQGTDSYAFSQLLKPSKSGIPKKLTHFRLALDAVRSTVGCGGALQERAPPKSVSESLTFIF